MSNNDDIETVLDTDMSVNNTSSIIPKDEGSEKDIMRRDRIASFLFESDKGFNKRNDSPYFPLESLANSSRYVNSSVEMSCEAGTFNQ